MEVSANLHVGCRVQATTKDDVKIGKVAFVGLTSFAPGKCCFIICSLMVNFCYIFTYKAVNLCVITMST